MEEDNKRECDKHEDSYYKKLTLPNVLTCFRMVSSVALCGYIATYGITSPLLITLATVGIGATDALDGYLARNHGMASQLGSVLDPIADKIYNWGLGITLMATGIMPLWPLLISARDITVAGITSYQFKKNGVEMKPTFPAKAKMFLQSAGLVATLAFGFGSSGLSLIAPICMGAAIATAVPEAFCIKKKYFSKKGDNEDMDFMSAEIRHNQEENKTMSPNENSKTLEYTSPTIENVKDNPKVMKKTIFGNSLFHSKNNNNSNTRK
ncbi:MAG: CDP-alcohol phosphatidyltransferase family protein [Bacilli bacterium]|nr:CDP-alcohol phosphatidyltransferase family protein [Bacilli bacterium]